MVNNNKQQQEYNASLAQAKKLIQDINRLRSQLDQDPLKLGDTEAVNNIQSLRNEFKQLANDIGGVNNTATNLFDQMVGIAKEFGAINKPANQLKSAFKGMVDQAAKMKNDELGLLDLRTRDLETIQKKLGLQNEAARIAASQFEGQRAAYNAANAVKGQEATLQAHINDLKSQAEELEKQGNDNGALIKLKSAERYEKQLNLLTKKRIGLQSQVEDEAAAAFAYLDDQNSTYDEINKKVGQRLVVERKISELTGVTGAVVGGTGALMERLGMRSGIFHDAMKDSAEEMRQMAKATAEGGEEFSKLQIAAKGFSVLAKGFSKALGDPAAIIGSITKSFLDVNKAQTEFIRLTGKSAKSLNGTQTEISTLVDLLGTASELTKQIGLDATSIFTPNQIAQISDAKELLGISAEQAGKLGMVMKLTGQSADELGNSIYDNVDAGVSKKLVYDDILSASDDIIASTGGNTEALAGAASAARKIGLELIKVNSIADGLMDFESSIGAELEAQLLTGKNINLSKARELALNNDLEGVAKELEKNGASAAEYAKMNRIQQQALAKALGVSRQELGKMVLTKEAMADMTADEIAAARGVGLEQSKQIDIQARIEKSIARMAQAFSPVLEAVVPIVESLLQIVGPIAAGIGKVANLFSGFVGPLVVAAGILKAMQLTMASIQIIQLAVNAAKGAQLTLDGSIIAALGLQNTYAAYQLVLETNTTGMAAARAVLEESILGSMVLQSYDMVKRIPKLLTQLGIMVAQAATYAVMNPLAAVAGLAVAAGIGGVIYSQMKTADDMVSQPGYGNRTLMGPEGAIALNNKDTVIAGTDLFSGEEQQGASTSIGGVDLTPLVTEIRQMKAEVSSVLVQILNKQGTVTLDGNKVGSALVLGSYKSS